MTVLVSMVVRNVAVRIRAAPITINMVPVG